jgi:AcrR family transcriptional regulator
MPSNRGDAAVTKAAILAEARLQFGEKGFDRTTIRSVASAVGVDPGLVMHYFGNKNALFEAASHLDIALPDMTGVAPGDVAGTLMPVFVQLWGPDGPLLPLLRAAASNRTAAHILLGVFAQLLAPALAPIAVDRAGERIAMIGAQMIGVAVARYIVGNPLLVAMDDETLTAWLRPVVAHYLTGEAPDD